MLLVQSDHKKSEIDTIFWSQDQTQQLPGYLKFVATSGLCNVSIAVSVHICVCICLAEPHGKDTDTNMQVQ